MLLHIERILRCLIIIFIGCSCTVYAFPRVDPALERLDEIHDAEIYQAVLTSMNAYYKRQLSKKTRIKREDSRVCYEAVGCFDASGPFGYLETLPSKPEEIDTKFLLYPGHSRRRSGTSPAEIPFASIKEAYQWAKVGFNKTLPTKVLIHGFGSDCNHIWIYEMRSALMAVEEVNVICVDWEKGAILPNYVKATANTRLVGKQLAMLLRGLVETNGLSMRNTHLIGFSLGAHVAGFTGSELGNLSRITGLDPAGPLFESQDPRVRLDQNDAGFVDVIHSNGENLILGGLGSYQPMGHVDFYPNGGRMQKGCSNLFVGAVSDIIWSSAVEGRSLCNHRRAYKFFTDSVSPRCHFPSFPCDSYEDFLSGKCFPCTDERACGNMGYYADRSKGRGQQYLITRDEEPFCAHQYLVKIETTPSAVPIISYGKIQLTLIGDSGLNETFMMTRKEDEEMKLGDSISRIIVPHPILQEPVQIEMLYTAYSGWLSSGLTQWRMDKVTISDSFGKTSSVCKKNLILDSGLAITLPLYPGECNLPGSYQSEAQDRIEITKNSTKSTFIPTPVVKIGTEILDKETTNNNIYWKLDEVNKIDEASESSRAFNTKIDSNGLKEIVEPILKPHSAKNGRSHDPERNKPEITEPILPPKPHRTIETSTKSDSNKRNAIDHSKLDGNKQNDTKWKREDGSKSLKNNEENPLEMLAMTVQFLPQRLARMFEQAEKYARETILPLVSTYTPKFISDIITPPKENQKYLPLFYEDTVLEEPKIEQEKRSVESRNFNPPPVETTTLTGTTTPYTHIQKIKRKTHKNILAMELKKIDDVVTDKSVYVDLPVFGEGPEKIKYIPVSLNETKPHDS